MPRARRIAVFQTSGGSSGGGTPTIGNVEWGPNFGGVDGDQFTAGVNADLSAVDLVHTKTCGCNVDLLSVDASYSNQTCGCNVDLFAVDPTYSLRNCGCNVDLFSIDTVYSKTCGCNVDLFAIDPTYSRTGGVHLSGSVLSAPFWQSEDHFPATAGNTTSIAVPYPSGIQSGDLLLAFCATSNATGSGAAVVDVPSGWNGSALQSLAGTAAVMFARVFWRAADGTESGSQTFNFSGATAGRATGEIHRIIGADTSSPVNATATATLLASALVTDPVSPAVTTTAANCMVFAFLAHSHAALSNTHTAPASHVERTDFQSTVTAVILSSTSATRVFASAASTGTATHDCTETVATDAVMIRAAIAPAAFTIAS